jgi:hypothetical protein
VSKLPLELTSFYDNWCIWDDDIKMVLKTIRVDAQCAFMASFYFKCNIEPKTLFEKTLLKMAKQSKHKGTVVIVVKPCQYLDTTWEIMFIKLPYCDV